MYVFPQMDQSILGHYDFRRLLWTIDNNRLDDYSKSQRYSSRLRRNRSCRSIIFGYSSELGSSFGGVTLVPLKAGSFKY